MTWQITSTYKIMLWHKHAYLCSAKGIQVKSNIVFSRSCRCTNIWYQEENDVIACTKHLLIMFNRLFKYYLFLLYGPCCGKIWRNMCGNFPCFIFNSFTCERNTCWCFFQIESTHIVLGVHFHMNGSASQRWAPKTPVRQRVSACFLGIII